MIEAILTLSPISSQKIGQLQSTIISPFALCTLISYNQHESHRLATPPPLFLCPSHLSVNLINHFPSSRGASSLFCVASFLF